MNPTKFLALHDDILNMDSVARIRFHGGGDVEPWAHVAYAGTDRCEVIDHPDDVQALEWATEMLTNETTDVN